MPAEEDCIIDFAGVRIETRLPAPLPAWVARLPLCRASASAATPFVGNARVQAVVVLRPGESRLASRLEEGVGKGIRVQWSGSQGSVRAPGMTAELTRSVSGKLSMQAALAGDRQSVASFVQATAVAVQSALGGCLLHAAAVELDGSALAFIGPSGAGKSTACTQLTAAHLFSWDRLLVVPWEQGSQGGNQPCRPEKWLAYSFPGGEPPQQAMQPSAAVCLPLAGVFRVRPDLECTVDALSMSQRVAELRAATLSGGRKASEELRLLSTLQALASCVPVGLLGFPLGASLETATRGFVLACASHAGIASRGQ